MLEVKNDPINPSHYKTEYGIETIDVIKAFTQDLNGVEGYAVGNIIKYITRYHHKNGIEDIKKSLWYNIYLLKYLLNGGDVSTKEIHKLVKLINDDIGEELNDED